MKITFKLGEPLWRAAGKREVAGELGPSEREGLAAPASVDAALNALAAAYPQMAQELHGAQAEFYYSLFVNDRLVVFAQRDKTLLKEGDTISLFLPLAGG